MGVQQPYAVLLAGPTASGKSDLALKLAARFGGHIINADSAQMYVPLVVGTAKPDWRSSTIPHHLFDSMAQPVNYDVVAYRETVRELIVSLNEKGIVPFLVGGSLFYHKSLFYPPHDISSGASSAVGLPEDIAALPVQEQWKELEKIDPGRAEVIHPNDTYRVQRALEVWFVHGVKPSTLKPKFQPFCDTHLIYLAHPRDLLTQRIAARTKLMLDRDGWINEALAVYAQPEWRDFIKKKKFIGYPEIFAWIEAGMPASEKAALVERIVLNTRAYAKRQGTFWRSFMEQLGKHAPSSPYTHTITVLENRASAYEEACVLLRNVLPKNSLP